MIHLACVFIIICSFDDARAWWGIYSLPRLSALISLPVPKPMRNRIQVRDTLQNLVWVNYAIAEQYNDWLNQGQDFRDLLWSRPNMMTA